MANIIFSPPKDEQSSRATQLCMLTIVIGHKSFGFTTIDDGPENTTTKSSMLSSNPFVNSLSKRIWANNFQPFNPSTLQPFN